MYLLSEICNERRRPTATSVHQRLDRYPRLVAAAGPMTACDDPEFHYRFGVDLFIAGVEAMARQQAG